MFSSIRVLSIAACLGTACSSASAIVVQPPAGSSAAAGGALAAPVGDSLAFMAFGAGAVALMVLCRSQERRVPWLSAGTFVCGMGAALYGIAVGAWPLALALGGYAAVCHCKWIASRNQPTKEPQSQILQQAVHRPWEESRMTRMFGPMS